MTPEEFYAVLRDMPQPVAAVRRLYHDAAGHPVLYTMEDLPGDWIEVDALTYAVASFDVMVKDGCVIEIPKIKKISKLHPSDHGTCCDPRDVCLVVPEDKPHRCWDMNHA